LILHKKPIIFFPYIKLVFIAGLLLLSCASAKAVTASFTADHTSGCSPLVISFTNSSTSATSYYWDFGNGSTSTLTNPGTSYSSTGTYTIKLVAYNSSGGADSTTLSITVYNVPSVSFTADTLNCVGSVVHFTDASTLYSSGAGSYTWNFGNGDTSHHQNPTYTYTTTGRYSITLSVTNSVGCASSLRKSTYVNVIAAPSVNFNADTTILCGPTHTAHFNNYTTGLYTPFSYYWKFGDGDTSTATSPSNTYTSYGSYTVTLVAKNSNGCKDSLIRSSYIKIASETASFSLSATDICIGKSVTVSNTSSPTYTNSNWSFGDGGTSTASSVTYTYNTAGIDTIRLISQNGCFDTTRKVVNVHARPVVSFSDSAAQPCPAPVNIYFNNLTTGGSTYKWYFGDGTTSTATNPVKTYYSDTFYTIKLIATSPYGCSDSITKTNEIKIYPIKLYLFGNGYRYYTGGCVPDTVSFSYYLYYDQPYSRTPITYPYSVASWNWNFGDGSSSTAANPSHRFTTAGTYKVVLNLTTSNGCGALSDTFYVYVGTPPTPYFTANPSTACAGTPITFTDTVGGADTYYWNFSDTVTGTSILSTGSPTIVYDFKLPGAHTITLTAVKNGCAVSYTRSSYVNIDSPGAVFYYYYSCDTNLRINFFNPSLSATSYLWDFGDGSTSTASSASVFHVFPIAGTYTVHLYTYNSSSGCHDTATQSVIVYDPKVNFSTNDTLICINNTVHLSSSLSGGILRPNTLITTPYTWVFDGTTIFSDTSSSINYTYYIKGYHTIKEIIYDIRNGKVCADTLTKTNYIGVAKPSAGFYASPLITCTGTSINFTDTTSDIARVSIKGHHWTWYDGSSETDTGSTTSHSYSTAGYYSVQLIDSDMVGCKDTLTKTNYLQIHHPGPYFYASTTYVCQRAPVTFYNASSGGPLTISWDFGDGTTATTSPITHYYSATGTYTVKLYITDTIGCKDSAIYTSYITVLARPTAKFTMDDTLKICSPMNVNFTDATTGGSSYAWDFGDGGGSGTGKTTSWTYLTAGKYTIKEFVTATNGCRDTATGTVSLLGYSGALTYSPIGGCRPLAVSFKTTVTVGVPDYIFDFGDGSIFSTTGTTASHTYATAGAYIPKIIFTNDSGCSSSSLGLDTVKVDSVRCGFYFRPFPACDSGDFTFDDTSYARFKDIASRVWVFHDGTTSTLANPVHHYTAPGTYSVTLVDKTVLGCSDSLKTSITIHARPHAIFKMSDSIKIRTGMMYL